jgi:hypothetical protein
MLPFSINSREAAISAGIFVIVIIGFVILANVGHWPNEQGGWPLAVLVAAIFAFLPIAPRVLSLLQQSGTTLEGPFGIKINFSAAAAVATIGATRLTDNLVDPGVNIFESTFKELNEAAVRATSQTIVVVNVEDGHAWYKTRLFALAATAEILHAPRFIVLIGQRGGQSMQIGGWIRPSDLVRAIIRSDIRYKKVWLRAQAYLHRVQANIPKSTDFPRPVNYQLSFDEDGAASFMFILVHQMRDPDKQPAPLPPPQPDGTQLPLPPALEPLEGGDLYPWISLQEVEAMTDAWLVRDAVDRDKSDSEQVDAVMAARGEIVVATRDGQYTGLIDVSRAERDLLRQLLAHPKPA